jgi:phage virion morphogenesis protein
MDIHLEIKDDAVKTLLSQVARRIGDMTPAMRKIAGIMHDSVEENFAAGGRPKWKPSQRAKEENGQTLQDSGSLAASIVQEYTHESATVGTNKQYAKVHQFGAKKHSFGTFTAKVRAHDRMGKPVKAHTRNVKLPWGDIPARPFMMLQNEDWTEITAALRQYLTA